ncbi:MAG TPA: transketolase [Desulfobacteraceae bacterium]|nr:transketolase [Desulfobacteraceae bacterium]
MPWDIKSLEKRAAQLRARLVEMSHISRASHLGSALSCVDILTALYWHTLDIGPANIGDHDRDRFILSKGHAISALYAVLAAKGIWDEDLLKTYCAPGSSLAEHPVPFDPPGVETATGSLGHGLSLGLGMALAGRIQQQDYQVYVLGSDGECNEGSVWEAAMQAAAKRVSNLCMIVDFNKWQATGRSCDVAALEPLRVKWAAFGWDSVEVDGHDMAALVKTLDRSSKERDRPMAIIAHTVKGKGVSFMEDDNNWHYRIPTREEVALAWQELGITDAGLRMVT